MSINCTQLKNEIIKPTLEHLGMYSESAVNLLLGTAAQESHMGKYIKQISGGPAVGIYQMEPATHDDIHTNYLSYRPGLEDKVFEFLGNAPSTLAQHLIGNLFYATAMARLHYLRVKEPLPKADDVEGLAEYWKDHYNTEAGKGTVEEFKENYARFCV